tara:strand:- start:1043 stop:1435 length:393 start_codon:yes stop_codon:yes gene_type:complete
MFTLISIILIIGIIFFLLIYKRKFIRKIKNRNIDLKINNKIQRNNSFDNSNLYNQTIYQKESTLYSNIEKYYLKKEMYCLFKGNKEDKLKALKIARKLSDKSTLNILRIGLKDMDSDIVKLSAELIENFR